MTLRPALAVILLAAQGVSSGAQAPAAPRADVAPPDRFRDNRTSFSAVMDVLGPTRPAVPQEKLDRLRSLPLEAIFAALGDYRMNYATGLQSTQPGERLVGRALTMRFLPARPDLERAVDALAKEADWDRRYYARAAEEAQPGDVVVAELGGEHGHVLFGDIAALGLRLRGVVGAVIDGGSRDFGELRMPGFKGFPVFARFFDIQNSRWLGVEYNAPVRVGAATVLPGDVVVAEDEGVIFFPPELIDAVIAGAGDTAVTEAYQRELLRSGAHRFRDVYPLSPALREAYEKEKDRRRPR